MQIPVEVQAASKVADEKRKRNAGASARFRARRKEKEREASMSISRLEQQVRDAIDRADFYRTERDPSGPLSTSSQVPTDITRDNRHQSFAICRLHHRVRHPR